jgi:xanthine dehydrogenase YagR molybdenum-binding subunit
MVVLMASKMIGKPVQATVTRHQMFTNIEHATTNEIMSIGAKQDAISLTALSQ